jgi:hypothetical protein
MRLEAKCKHCGRLNDIGVPKCWSCEVAWPVGGQPNPIAAAAKTGTKASGWVTLHSVTTQSRVDAGAELIEPATGLVYQVLQSMAVSPADPLLAIMACGDGPAYNLAPGVPLVFRSPAYWASTIVSVGPGPLAGGA